ncbi:MAG: hypothetical protein ACLTW9_14850 [Enterocloster sp.]
MVSNPASNERRHMLVDEGMALDGTGTGTRTTWTGTAGIMCQAFWDR